MSDKNNRKMSNHVEEYFNEVETSQESMAGKQLFSGNEEDIDLKTDINEKEIREINTLFFNDRYLERIGLKAVYNVYYNKFMRLVISKNRQSRNEFVNINKNNDTDDMIEQMSNLSNLTRSRK